MPKLKEITLTQNYHYRHYSDANNSPFQLQIFPFLKDKKKKQTYFLKSHEILLLVNIFNLRTVPPDTEVFWNGLLLHWKST